MNDAFIEEIGRNRLLRERVAGAFHEVTQRELPQSKTAAQQVWRDVQLDSCVVAVFCDALAEIAHEHGFVFDQDSRLDGELRTRELEVISGGCGVGIASRLSIVLDALYPI